MGPVLVTADEIGDPQDLAISCSVGGERDPGGDARRRCTSASPRSSATARRSFTLEPGDVIATGTPSASASSANPPRFLADGDRVAVEIERDRAPGERRAGSTTSGRRVTGPAASGERFLVTGALGCIGAWTVRALVREGVPVVAFDLGRDPRRLAQIVSPTSWTGSRS